MTIDDGEQTFQFEEGMTWEEWLDSKYNTYNFAKFGESIGKRGVSDNVICRIWYNCAVLSESQLNDIEYSDAEIALSHPIFEKVNYRQVYNSGGVWFCDDICSKELPYYILMDSNGNLTCVEN